MRESKEDNNLFYTCSLIEYIARKTKNTKKYIVEKLGLDNIKRIYNLADVYHCEDIEKVSDEFILKCNIQNGNYDILLNLKYSVPTYFDIGKVYKRLIIMLSNSPKDYMNNLEKVLTSWIIPKIDNYNSSMYYENPEYIYECFIEGKIL